MNNNESETAIARTPKPIDGFNRLIQSPAMQRYLLATLHDRRDSFVANVTALVGGNAMLQACDPAAVIMTAVKATALDLPLDPGLGFAYVIPYQSAGGLVPQFQLGAKGYVQLALRTGQFRRLNVRDVREGEITGSDFLSGEMTFSEAPDRDSLPVVGYVAYFELNNGFRKSFYMTRGEVEAHALRYSKSYKNRGGVWANNFDAMAKKTALKLLLGKYAPMSVEMAEGINSDGGSFTAEDGGEAPIYIDNGGEVPQQAHDYATEIMNTNTEIVKEEDNGSN